MSAQEQDIAAITHTLDDAHKDAVRIKHNEGIDQVRRALSAGAVTQTCMRRPACIARHGTRTLPRMAGRAHRQPTRAPIAITNASSAMVATHNAMPLAALSSSPVGAQAPRKDQRRHPQGSSAMSGLGEKIKGNIASADQTITTGLRDATHAAAAAVGDAASKVTGGQGGYI